MVSVNKCDEYNMSDITELYIILKIHVQNRFGMHMKKLMNIQHALPKLNTQYLVITVLEWPYIILQQLYNFRYHDNQTVVLLGVVT